MNDKGNSSTPPIYDHQPQCHMHTHTQTHICGGVCARVCGGDVLQAENYHSILHGEKKRCKVSDEFRKDCNPVKGDTQPNREMHFYRGRGGEKGGLVMT